MDLRPPCRGAARLAGGRLPVWDPETAPKPVAPVGAPSPQRTLAVPTGSAPADLRRALPAIVAQLRNAPRAIIGDPAEVVHFLNRQARALERARDMLLALPMSPQAPPRTPAPLSAPTSPPHALSARERAEAVFGGPAAQSAPIALPAPRTITDRRGRGVRVEVRRARAAGQMELEL